MNKGQLYHLSYVSTGCCGLKYEHIKEILESSVKNNKELGLTGILIYCNNHFFQILEGEREKVEEIFSKISIDPRHDNVIKLQSTNIEERQFADWCMGFKSYNKELKQLDTFSSEQFYTYIKHRINCPSTVSLKILSDFFDLNG